MDVVVTALARFGGSVLGDLDPQKARLTDHGEIHPALGVAQRVGHNLGDQQHDRLALADEIPLAEHPGDELTRVARCSRVTPVDHR